MPDTTPIAATTHAAGLTPTAPGSAADVDAIAALPAVGRALVAFAADLLATPPADDDPSKSALLAIVPGLTPTRVAAALADDRVVGELARILGAVAITELQSLLPVAPPTTTWLGDRPVRGARAGDAEACDDADLALGGPPLWDGELWRVAAGVDRDDSLELDPQLVAALGWLAVVASASVDIALEPEAMPEPGSDARPRRHLDEQHPAGAVAVALARDVAATDAEPPADDRSRAWHAEADRALAALEQTLDATDASHSTEPAPWTLADALDRVEPNAATGRAPDLALWHRLVAVLRLRLVRLAEARRRGPARLPGTPEARVIDPYAQLMLALERLVLPGLPARSPLTILLDPSREAGSSELERDDVDELDDRIKRARERIRPLLADGGLLLRHAARAVAEAWLAHEARRLQLSREAARSTRSARARKAQPRAPASPLSTRQRRVLDRAAVQLALIECAADAQAPQALAALAAFFDRYVEKYTIDDYVRRVRAEMRSLRRYRDQQRHAAIELQTFAPLHRLAELRERARAQSPLTRTTADTFWATSTELSIDSSVAAARACERALTISIANPPKPRTASQVDEDTGAGRKRSATRKKKKQPPTRSST